VDQLREALEAGATRVTTVLSGALARQATAVPAPTGAAS
jgi:hypothetical protein